MMTVRQNATHKVVIGPVVAVGDGFTPVTTLAVSSADEAEAILHDNGTVVDISGYTFAAITTADGYYHLTLQSGISGTVGHLTIVINDDSLCLPVRADFQVVEEAVYDALFAASAPGYVANAPVNVAQISGDATAADNLEAALDGTGGVTITAGLTGNVTGNLSGSVGSVTGAVGSVTGNVGGNLDGNVVGSVGSVAGGVTGLVGGITGTITSLDALDTAQDTQHATTQGKVDTAQADLDLLTGTDGATLATSQPNYAPATATALATAQSDLDTITGSDGVTLATAQGLYAPSKAGDAMALTSGERTTLTAAIWAALTSGLTTAGSIGKKLADWTIHSAADVWSVATRVLTANTNLNDPTAAAIADAVWDEATSGHAVSGSTGEALTNATAPTAAAVADAVWDEALSGHAVSGSAGEAMSAAGGAADPLLNAVPGSYGSGTAGEALGDIAGIKAKTDLITTGTTVSIIAPTVGAGGTITIEQGDDYTGGDLDITVPGTHDLTGATVVFRSPDLNTSMSVQSSGGSSQTVRMTLSSSVTAALPTGTRKYQIDATLSSGAVKTIARGLIIVREDL